MNASAYWFKSTLFEIEPGEDDEVNGRYGRQLANWLKAQLEQRGYDVEDVILEDWGRCLMCSRDPFLLWVGVGNMDSLSRGLPPQKENLVWSCFVEAEVFFWKRWFQKIETKPAVAKLYSDLGEILSSREEITLVSEP